MVTLKAEIGPQDLKNVNIGYKDGENKIINISALASTVILYVPPKLLDNR